MPFIFKGGSCLMLLMDHPRRLSTDIDITVKPGMDLKQYLDLASEIFPFKAVEENIRIGKNNIEKKHFKFTYDSPINGKPFYILLDVLFEHNHYSELVSREIRNDLLLTEPEYLMVSMPSANCILADKLTALAPHTTGIPLNAGKNMEVMKQFYDVTSLLDIFTDFSQIRPTYEQISNAEIAYRGIECTSTDCLWDTFYTALCIASRGKVRENEYPLHVKGIHDLRNHIYVENFTAEIAAERAVKIMYMTACLLANEMYEPVENYKNFLGVNLNQEMLTPLHYFRKANPEAYAYIVKTDELLSTIDMGSIDIGLIDGKC